MAVVWIITTGNSDVKLRSDYQWGDLHRAKKEALSPCFNDFEPSEEDGSGLWTLPARVMGTVYGDALDTHWKYFEFPLLCEFKMKFEEPENKKLRPDRIIVLLTNQEEIFLSENDANPHYDRSDPDCPFWRDTCTLKPILEKFLVEEFEKKFRTKEVQFFCLSPKSYKNGLDVWDSTLKLVQEHFDKWEISKADRVIVSHQAGTPAISSAVQLTSLSMFGKKVNFLVSNEFIKGQAKFLEGSSYFAFLQVEEAKDLLREFNYSGVEKALDKIEITEISDSSTKEKIDHLIELAKLWSAAKFEEFASARGGAAINRSKEWWWKGYEMAYLALIRMTQVNPTEAFFHSIRAVEGLICEWAIKTYSSHIRYKFHKIENGKKNTFFRDERYFGGKDGAPVAKSTIRTLSSWGEFEKLLKRRDLFSSGIENKLKQNKLGLYGQVLYTLFKATFEGSIDEFEKKFSTHSINIIWDELADKRNELFHRLQGLKSTEVYEAWGCNNLNSHLAPRQIDTLPSTDM